MNDRCPNCNQKVIFAKREKLIDCPSCKAKILLVTINGKKELFDVTPKEELKK